MNIFENNGRSNVLSDSGMAATSHPLASLEAITILKEGGNAVDAAIAASLVLSVVEPNASGLGGDCFALISKKNKQPISYNGSGIAPKQLDLSFFKKKEIKKINLESPHAVTIPGALNAWSKIHEEHGKLDYERLFIKAIEYAENGFNISEKVSQSWKKNIIKLNNNKNTKEIFLKSGKNYDFTNKFFNQPLANSLKLISKKGSREFYEGSIAKDIVNTLKELGGVHTLEDLSVQNTLKSNSIFCSYKDLFIHQCPPNGPGVTVLIMMKMMDKLKIENYDPMSFERFHLEGEITKQAFKFREENISDKQITDDNLKKILSDENINGLLEDISISRCLNVGNLNIPAHPETTYLSVIDQDLNVVSLINSICYAFGSGITTKNTGILLHNRGVNFRLQENHPNCINGFKRPLHTIIPGMVVNKNFETTMSYGVMGGQFQPVGHVHFLNNIIDYKMSVQKSIDFPRAFNFNGKFILEKEINLEIEKKLSLTGHNTFFTDDYHGGGQAIKIDYKNGVLIGGSDFRKDGCALGL